MYDVLKLIGEEVVSVSYLAPDGQLALSGIDALSQESRERCFEGVPFLDFLRPHFFFVEEGVMVIARSLPALLALRRERGFNNEFDGDGLHAYKDAGLVLPPWTIVRNVYQVPALSELLLENARYSLKYRGLGVPERRPFSSADDMFDELKQVVARGLNSSQAARVVCTVSGGADSAALLGIVCEVVDPGRVCALTCQMPDLEGEVDRARKIADRFGVGFQIFSAAHIHPEEIIDEFVRTHANLVFDPVVPVITTMFERCIGDQLAGGHAIVVEGQGADTVSAGLPHNVALNVYREALSPIFRLLCGLLPGPSEWLRSKFRLGYRTVKMMRALAEPNWRRALLCSLDFERAAYPSLYDRLELMLQTMAEGSGDRQKAVMLFFLHILQAREAQKYQMLPIGVDVLLPFMDIEFMRRCYATPTPFFLRGTRRKIPINERVREQFPELFTSERTMPFAVQYSFSENDGIDRAGKRGDGTYAQLKAYSVAQLGKQMTNRC
jgi:asparagine synthetase B (glutamine-hydrolysing)